MSFSLFRSEEDRRKWEKEQAARKLRQKTMMEEDAQFGKGVGPQEIPLGLSEAEYERQSLEKDKAAYKAKEAQRFEEWQQRQADRNRAFLQETKQMERELKVKGASDEQINQFKKNRQEYIKSQQQGYTSESKNLDLSGKSTESKDFTQKGDNKPKSNSGAGDKARGALMAYNELNASNQSGGTTSSGAGAAEGALSAMAITASFGGVDPVSQSVAAAVGGTYGALKAKSARKAAQRKAAAEAEATYRDSLANIELDKSSKINAALQNMQVGFQNSLLRKLDVRL